MDTKPGLRWGLFLAAFGAVLIALVLFKVRVAVAGGKYALALVAILVTVWLVSRWLRK